ncbi:prepilin peptidase [Rhizobium sp. AG855]|uniref:A24 family peptidase n=1 Tax=Rhizobium sp. AG855 TaxID=2183898 RepID=UPI000E7722D8|nr:prepilin peptidase [Rhizobium sp. AG855]RKE78144.1 prepilin peptidase CpaA [Rhizobium sp. AG855]
MITAIIFVVPPLCLAIAALTDFLEMTIPNRVSAALLGSFLLVAPFCGLTLTEFGLHLLASVVVFCVCFALFALNVMGGGDAKLLTAASLWFGFNISLFEFLAFTGYLGGLVTLAIVLMRSNWDKLATLGVRLPQTLMHEKKVPYGIAIGAAGLMAYPDSPLMVAAIASIR